MSNRLRRRGGSRQNPMKVELEETKRQLGLFKKALFNANQYLVRLKEKEAAEEEKRGATLKTVGGGGGGQEEPAAGGAAKTGKGNPLELLPKEMWMSIFNWVESWRDFESCYDTCQLFRALLEDTKNIRAFPEVLPLLADELGPEGILKCRQICTDWKKEVDHSFPQTYSLTLLYSENLRSEVREEMEELRDHGKNPFVGGTVVISNDELDLEEALDEGMMEAQLARLYLEDLAYFLEGLAGYLTDFTLNLRGDTIMGAKDICQVILMTLNSCQNMKSFTVKACISGGLLERDVDQVTPSDFKISQNLQVLHFTRIAGFWPVLNRIFRRCSGQLKRIVLGDWRIGCNGLDWGSLEELKFRDFRVIGRRRDPPVFQGLLEMVAPKLNMLTVRMNDGGNLQDLLRITNRFPSLEYLRLEQCTGYNANQVDNVTNGLIASDKLKTLEFRVWKLFQPDNYDMLIYFPFLETLMISVWSMEEWEEEDKRLNGLFELSAGWLTSQRIYESNVWELLPCLETLVVGHWQRFPTPEIQQLFGGDPNAKTVFTRKEYKAAKGGSGNLV